MPKRPSYAFWSAALTLLTVAALTFAASLAPVRAGARSPSVRSLSPSTICQTSGPPAGTYTITVCFVTPTDGATLTGTPTVSISTSISGTSPGIQRAVYYLDGQIILTAFASPYSFVLPTNHWSDGTHLFEVEPQMRDGFIARRAAINLIFHNGVSTPPVNTATYTPTGGKSPPPGSPLVVAAVGDGAGGESGELAVTNIIASWNPNLMLYLGDVYEDGLFSEFYNWYGATGQFYGRFRTITNPTIGNHEYTNGQAPGYFDYWNNVPDYYSFYAGGWHFISLNSNTSFVSAAPGSPQYSWLAQDLNATTAACTIVYYHHPLYNVGPEGPTTTMAPVWALLVQHGVTVVLNGHDHDYQRWVPLGGAGQADPKGATQFVAGTGGHSSQTFITTDPRLAVGIDNTKNRYGALQLQLGASSARFQYISSLGAVLDSGVIPCVNPANGSPTPTPSSTPISAHHYVFLPVVVRPSNSNPGGNSVQSPAGTEGQPSTIEVGQ